LKWKVRKPVLVGVGTDGPSVNISEQNGMRGILQCVITHGYSDCGVSHTVLNWPVRILCLVTCLMILTKCCSNSNYTYLNEKTSKKCHELADIVKKYMNFLKVGIYLSELWGAAGYHKRNALQRV